MAVTQQEWDRIFPPPQKPYLVGKLGGIDCVADPNMPQGELRLIQKRDAAQLYPDIFETDTEECCGCEGCGFDCGCFCS